MVGVQGPESSAIQSPSPIQTTLSRLPLPSSRIWARTGPAMLCHPMNHSSMVLGGVVQGASYAPQGVRAGIAVLKQLVSTETMGACG